MTVVGGWSMVLEAPVFLSPAATDQPPPRTVLPVGERVVISGQPFVLCKLASRSLHHRRWQGEGLPELSVTPLLASCTRVGVM